MSKKQEMIVPEWSHVVDVESIRSWPLKIEITPQDSQRNALVQRLGILALDSCMARITLNQDKGSQIIHVKGVIEADIRQNCVITMEVVSSHVEEKFESWYADSEKIVSLTKARRDKQVEKGRGEMPILTEKEDPEPITDGKIDVGELATQYLSLAIDPYPRAKGVEEAEITQFIADEAAAAIRKSPFDALKDWKDRLK